jgi:excisionase family DNA binding protein
MSSPLPATATYDGGDHESVPDWQQRPTVPVDVAAQLLGISRASAFRAVHRGQLPSIRLGRRIVIPTAALRALLGLGG